MCPYSYIGSYAPVVARFSSEFSANSFYVSKDYPPAKDAAPHQFVDADVVAMDDADLQRACACPRKFVPISTGITVNDFQSIQPSHVARSVGPNT